MNADILTNTPIDDLEKDAFENGLLKPMPFEYYEGIDPNKLKILMWKYGIYVLPTIELIEWLKKNIKGKAIEIGAGVGTIGRALGIPITDSRLQEQPEIKQHYEAMNQPVIKYPDDIIKLDAEEAILKYKPDTVIGAFITHKWEDSLQSGNYWGVDEHSILKNVKKYINIGNTDTHKEKPILKEKHYTHSFYWLITRSVNQANNQIWVFNK